MPESRRRKTVDGKRVLVCGHPVDYKQDLICILPPKTHLSHTLHVALAINVERQIVLGFRKEGEKEVEWRGIAE